VTAVGRAEVSHWREFQNLSLMDAAHVASWHETEVPKYLGNVRYWMNSGKHLLLASISPFDPERT
jgi:hypothetical protein